MSVKNKLQLTLAEGESFDREHYLEMLNTGAYRLTKDQIAVLAAVRYGKAYVSNSEDWALLLSLGLVAFDREEFEKIHLTTIGYTIFVQVPEPLVAKALLDYREISGAAPFEYLGRDYIRTSLSISELPEFLVHEDKDVRMAAQSRLRDS